MGAKRLGGKRPGGKRLGGETTRGGNGLGAKRPGFAPIGFRSFAVTRRTRFWYRTLVTHTGTAFFCQNSLIFSEELIASDNVGFQPMC